MKISIPYLVSKEREGKPPLWYWIPSPQLKRLGWDLVSYGKPVETPDGFRLLETAEEIFAHASKRSEEAKKGARQAAAAPKPEFTIGGWIDQFKEDREYTRLAAKSQRYYTQGFDVIRNLPISDSRGRSRALGEWAPASMDKAAAKELIEEVEEARGLATARQVYASMRRLYNWAPMRRLSSGDTLNPFGDLRVETLEARRAYWTEAEVEALLKLCDSGWRGKRAQRGLGDAIALAYYLGQRQGDVIRIAPSQRLQTVTQKAGKTVALDAIHIRQRKTAAPLAVRVHEALAHRLSRLTWRSPKTPYAMTADNTPFREDHFRHLFAAFRDQLAKDMPQVAAKQFRDLRRSSVVKLGELGMTAIQIAAVTGHSYKTVEQILEVYCIRTLTMTDSAMDKWEEQQNAQKQ